MLVASDAAAELVQVGEAEVVGAVDEDRIDGRDVNPGFDNCRADEDVRLAMNEAKHDVLKLFALHLAVADQDPCLRNNLVKVVRYRLDRVDAIVDEIDLPVAIHLAQDGFADQL